MHYLCLRFLTAFSLVLAVLLGVHFIANDPLALLLAGDGCGQIVDHRLHVLIKLGLWAAHVVSCLAAFSFAAIVTYGHGKVLFFLSAIVSMFSFLVGGTTHLRYSDHLNACDIFFKGSDAPYLNFSAVGLLVLLAAIVFYKREQS